MVRNYDRHDPPESMENNNFLCKHDKFPYNPEVVTHIEHERFALFHFAQNVAALYQDQVFITVRFVFVTEQEFAMLNDAISCDAEVTVLRYLDDNQQWAFYSVPGKCPHIMIHELSRVKTIKLRSYRTASRYTF